MNRWLGIAALSVALALPAAAQTTPTAAGAAGSKPATPAAATAPGAAGSKAVTPAAQPAPLVRIAVPMIGQSVATKVDFPGFSIRELTLMRRKDDSGQNVITARVRVLNPGAKAVTPAFRVILYAGRELLGQIPYPAAHELPVEIAPATTYPWTKGVIVNSTKLPDAAIVAPPEVENHEGAPATGTAPGAAGLNVGRPGTGRTPTATMPGGRPGGAPTGTMPGGRPGAPAGQPGQGDRRRPGGDRGGDRGGEHRH